MCMSTFAVIHLMYLPVYVHLYRYGLFLQDQCNCAQIHLLSLHMEPILHNLCPLNCQDLLSWLPSNLAFCILSFLDPGIATCICMNKTLGSNVIDQRKERVHCMSSLTETGPTHTICAKYSTGQEKCMARGELCVCHKAVT